ncbi:hypothetical protein D3C81_1251280 [compost metagenome]
MRRKPDMKIGGMLDEQTLVSFIFKTTDLVFVRHADDSGNRRNRLDFLYDFLTGCRAECATAAPGYDQQVGAGARREAEEDCSVNSVAQDERCVSGYSYRCIRQRFKTLLYPPDQPPADIGAAEIQRYLYSIHPSGDANRRFLPYQLRTAQRLFILWVRYAQRD